MVIKSSTKIFKSGNSSAVRLSKDIMDAAGLKVNDQIDVTFDDHDGTVVIRAVHPDKNFHDSFSQLLAESMEDDQAALNFLKDK